MAGKFIKTQKIFIPVIITVIILTTLVICLNQKKSLNDSEMVDNQETKNMQSKHIEDNNEVHNEDVPDSIASKQLEKSPEDREIIQNPKTQREYNLDDAVGNGLTVRDVKIMEQAIKEYCKEVGLTEEETKKHLENEIGGLGVPIEVLESLPDVDDENTQVDNNEQGEKSSKQGGTEKPKQGGTVSKPKEQPKKTETAKPKQQPTQKPAEKPKKKSSDGYTRELGVPGTFPKTAGDKNGDGIEDAFQSNGTFNVDPVQAGTPGEHPLILGTPGDEPWNDEE